MTWDPDTTRGPRGRSNRRRGQMPFDPTGAGPSREQRRQHHPGHPGGEREAFGPGGRGPRGPRGDRRRGSRARRDVRGAILVMLTAEPMHGYQLMQSITDRSNGNWTPSPGAIYPALSQLEDEGLVTISTESGRKVASLTEAGRTAASSHADPFAADDDSPAGPDLREAVGALHVAAREVGRSGSPAQREKARRVVDEARRALYLILADADHGSVAEDAQPDEG